MAALKVGGVLASLRAFSQAVTETVLLDAVPTGIGDGHDPEGTTAL
jgi:hypothetical protein